MKATLPNFFAVPPSLWRLIKYFLYLGFIGFGGPLALIGYMRRDLVEKRGWISHSNFLNGLALSSLCPGPLATQVAVYIGWLHARILGATAVLIALTLPAFLMILTLAIAYTHYGDVSWARSAFYGISACVIAIVIRNAYELSKMIVARDHWLWVVFILNIFIATTAHIQIYWTFLISGLLVWIIKTPPQFLYSSIFLVPFSWNLESLGNHHIIAKLFLYFAWAGTVVFGSGYAVIPFIHEGVVQNYHWLSETQFMDAISIGMITPGPIVLAVAFMGYLIAGIKGALVTTIGIFLPCYLCVILFAPHFHRIAHHEGVKAFIQGVTIAVAGAITGSAITLGKSAITDLPTVGIFLGTSFMLYQFKKIREPVWLLIAAGVGMLCKGFSF
jgi:chromate transporter